MRCAPDDLEQRRIAPEGRACNRAERFDGLLARVGCVITPAQTTGNLAGDLRETGDRAARLRARCRCRSPSRPCEPERGRCEPARATGGGASAATGRRMRPRRDEDSGVTTCWRGAPHHRAGIFPRAQEAARSRRRWRSRAFWSRLRAAAPSEHVVGRYTKVLRTPSRSAIIGTFIVAPCPYPVMGVCPMDAQPDPASSSPSKIWPWPPRKRGSGARRGGPPTASSWSAARGGANSPAAVSASRGSAARPPAPCGRPRSS